MQGVIEKVLGPDLESSNHKISTQTKRIRENTKVEIFGQKLEFIATFPNF